MSIFSIEAEQAVIGGLMIAPMKYDAVAEIIRAEDFFRADHRIIYTHIAKANRSELDAITLMDSMDACGDLSKAGGHGYLIDLVGSIASSANILAYARIVKDKSRRRQVAEIMQLAHDEAVSSSDSVEVIAARAASQIGTLQTDNRLSLVRDTSEILSSVVSKMDDRLNSNGSLDGLPTGLAALDSRYLGWKSGDLVVMAGRPSMGKSALAFQIAGFNAMAKRKVMCFSLEMTAEKIMERLIANTGRIHLGDIKDPKRNKNDDLWVKLSAAVGRLKNIPLVIDETPGLHVNQMCARARAEHMKGKVSLIVVDHINIAAGDGQSREREIAHITGALKGLAKELGCPVLALSQLNRGVESRPNKRPLMSDLRDSGAIEQDADIVILLYRDEYYDENSVNKGVIEINTGKFREGEVGTDYCSAQLHMGMIADLSPDYSPQESQTTGKRFEY